LKTKRHKRKAQEDAKKSFKKLKRVEKTVEEWKAHEEAGTVPREWLPKEKRGRKKT